MGVEINYARLRTHYLDASEFQLPVLRGVFIGTQCLAKAGGCSCTGLFLLFPRNFDGLLFCVRDDSEALDKVRKV
jgi:hypothetical protein